MHAQFNAIEINFCTQGFDADSLWPFACVGSFPLKSIFRRAFCTIKKSFIGDNLSTVFLAMV